MDGVNVVEGSLVNARQQKLYTVSYLPQSKPVAQLVFQHGLGEYIGRYKPVFMKLASSGIAVHSHDAHGHGQSEPTAPSDRAVIWRFEDLVDDLFQVADAAAASYPQGEGVPVFIGGHSLGGLVAAYAALRQQSRWLGCILHSAAIDVEWTLVLKLQAPLGGLLGSLMPRARIVPAVRPEDMSVDPQVVAQYKADTMITHGNVAARTGAVILKAFRGLAKRQSELSLPLYACHGAADRCTSLPAVKRLLEAVPSKDTTMHEIPGAFHELLHGPEREECVSHMVEWMIQRVQALSKL